METKLTAKEILDYCIFMIEKYGTKCIQEDKIINKEMIEEIKFLIDTD